MPVSAPGVAAIDEVVELLNVVALADRSLAEVLDRIAASPAPVHPATVAELESLLEDQLRPGVEARAVLAAKPLAVVQAGILRRAQLGPAGPGSAR